MIERTAELPFAWRAALGAVQAFYPEAVIAGGALRDLLTGREAKDIDIFINAFNSNAYFGIRSVTARSARQTKDTMMPVFGIEPKMVINPEFCEYSKAIDGVKFAMEIAALGVLPIQIIALDEPVTMQSACERIDFGICRVASDGVTIFRHPDFLHDLEHECFTFRATNRGPAQMDRSLARYNRLAGKFAGWHLRGMEGYLAPEPVDVGDLFA